MSSLIIRRGIVKQAAEEDGPSFEQQLGILTNALIADKYPKLDRMKLAFQIIELNDEHTEACGAAVYLVGRNVIMIPSFYKNSKINTGDMMFLVQTQQFIPLSDPWLAWVQDKELMPAGKNIDTENAGTDIRNDAMTVKDNTDPIIKTACVYLRGLLHSDPDLKRVAENTSLLDTVTVMGKTASCALLDKLVDNPDFLNAALRFYKPEELDGFAKKASAMAEVAPEVEVVMPFTKEAAELSPEEQDILRKDGYLIKKASTENLPDVIEVKKVRNMFTALSRPGKMQLLCMDGSVHTCLVMRKGELDLYGHGGGCPESICCSDIPDDSPYTGGRSSYGEPGPAHRGMTHRPYIRDNRFFALTTNNAREPMELAPSTMILADAGNKDFEPSMLADYGSALNPSTVDKLEYGSYILCPDGTAYRICGTAYAHNKGWFTTDNMSIVLADNAEQHTPIVTSNMIILPKNSRVLLKPERDTSDERSYEERERDQVKGMHAFPFVQFNALEAFMAEYVRKNYRKVKITSNGSEAYFGGSRTESVPMSVKEASLHLVKDYGVSPESARAMMHVAFDGASSGNPKSETFLITKTAAEQDPWEDANIAAHKFTNRGDIREFVEMPTVIEDPVKLQQAVTTAAENGIKEVFDVTAFKLLIHQNRFLEEIHDDIPMFMNCLDSLCRKLFLFYWHTKDFEEQYGMIKMKALEDSIKNAIDTLSELTIFFKRRSVDNGGIGQDGGDLMKGHDL